MSEQLVAYIRDALNKGASKEHIVKMLSDSGWKELDIQNAFSLLGKNNEQNNSRTKPFSIKFLTFFYLLFSVLFVILTIWSLQQTEPGPAPFFTGFIAIFSIITAVSLFLFNAAFLTIAGTSTLILLLFLFYLVFLFLDPIQNLSIANTLQPIFSEAGLTLFVTWAIFYAIAFCFGFTLVIVLKTLAEKLMKQPTRKGLMAFLIFIALVIPMLLLSLKLATGIKKYSTYKENTVQAVAQISMSDFIEETVPDLNDILSETDTLFY